MIRKNLTIIVVVGCLYVLNNAARSGVEAPWLAAFMNGYFNDIICGAGFMAYCNIFIELWKRPLKKLIGIEAVLLCAGLCWELAAPLFVKGSVGDPWDVAAYLLGGFVYWLVITIKRPEKEKTC